ncbi:MAG TPA: Ig-like domain repeat protein [Pyrinomonadaceae bacterium]|nr:Ig-like domain repeat protein [Pyrinomonadaceae bacterium]
MASQTSEQVPKKRPGGVPASLRTGVLFVNAPVASFCVNPGGTGGCSATIQGAVNAASSGDTINIAAGSYPEQVTISKSLTIVGADKATTMLTTPASLVSGIGGNLILLQIDTAANVEVSGITIAGPRIFAGCSAQIFYGVYVAGGAILNLHDAAVTDIRLQNPALAGCQDGIAIRAGSQALGQTATVTVNNSTITGYQKSAVIVDGTGSSGTITNNVITGLGLENTAENAIQISRSAAATISGNTITGNQCSNTSCGPDPVTQSFGTGVLIFSTSGVIQINNNTISTNDTGVYNNDPNTTISGNTMVGNRFNGIFLDQGNATVTGNTFSGPMNVGVIAVSFNGNGGNSSGTLTGNTITGAGIGLQLIDETGADAFVPQMTAHFNRIVATTTAISNAQNEPVNFENNWWGCNAGPGNAGCGAVSGTAADFNPWFVVAASATPNSINAGSTSNVAADMTKNSDGAVPGSALPDLPISFSATNGTMTPPSGTVSAGAASSTFTSTNNNSSVVTVTVDNQNLNVPITVIPAPVTVTPAITPSGADNDYTRINNAIQAALPGQTITLNGTFNWTEANAAASWALGSDGVASTGDDYEILVPANLNNVTLTANNLGDATIQGPGDLAGVNLESVFVFDGGDNQNWTISKLNIFDFDLSIGMFSGAGGSDAFNNTHITNNHIRIARDLNATVAPADVNQNIGIHYSFGTNIVINGNTIEIQGDGISNGSNFATDVGMQSNTSGGNVYDGLQITNNIIRVLNAQDATNPQVILGIWENAHGHSSNITVSGNQFINQAAGNNAATNLQRGFRVTSHSSATTTVTYSNNTVTGANIGFQWIAGSNFTGNQPVKLTSNTITNGGTGALVQSQGLATLSFNRIVGNSVAGLNNVDGTVTAENNWWGCNAGPGNTGCDGVLGTVDFNPWLILGISASPGTIGLGGTSTITTDMTHNSDAAVPSITIFVPNTPISFGGTLGTMTPPAGTLSSGQATSTFTSTSAGNGSASATVDNQTVSTPITISKGNQTITVNTHAPANATYNSSFTVAATSSSGLAVAYSSAGVCTNVGATFTMTSGTGTCTVKYDQAGDTNFNAAAQVTESVTAQKANQTITFGALAGKTFGDADFAVSATASSTLAVSFNASGQCTVTGSTVHLTAAGSCTITAKQAGDANFNAAVDVPQSFSIARAASTTTVTSSLNPSSPTQSVTFTATVTGPVGTGTPTGTVQFKDNGSAITCANAGGQALNVSGVATCQVSSLTAGTHTITADYSGDTNFLTSTGTLSGGQVVNNQAVISLSQSNYNVNENVGFVTITVNRTGDLSVPVTVDYATDDTGASIVCSTLNSGLAASRCDFGLALGTLRFAAAQTQKTFTIPITQDSFTEGPEAFTVNLSNPTGTGAVLASPASATVTISDSAAPAPNANDDTDAFVRQQYRDFLFREADPSGLAFWKNNIDECNDPAHRPAGQTLGQCIEIRRINTSAAFFLSIEFQQTGNLVRSCYVASLNRPLTNNMPAFVEFERDRQAIANGVIVLQGNWQQTLLDNRDAFLRDFVTRAEFVGLYPTVDSPTQYVDKLYLHASITPTSSERATAIAEFGGATTAADAAARGRALFDVTQNAAFQQREVNRSFVQMEYFGYLRRNPNDAPDGNFVGYDFWLNKLNAFNGNYIESEMVKAFLSSNEYRHRFGP